MEPIRVSVSRGGVVEAVHRVHAVAVQDGAVVAEAGDSDLVAFMRSSSKPLQAIPLAWARADADDRDLAIASASHLADEDQLAAARALLAKAPATESELECGPAGHPPSRLKHNCSGKHAGMLALCRARGWRSEGYRRCRTMDPVRGLGRTRGSLASRSYDGRADRGAHAVRVAVVDRRVVDPERLRPQRASVHGDPRGRLAHLDGGDRVASAMRTHPLLIRGPLATDTRLMQALPGWIAKGGAEGLLCAASDDLGIALKAEDGNGRGLAPAAAAFLAKLDLEVPALGVVPLENSRGEPVGEIRV